MAQAVMVEPKAVEVVMNGGPKMADAAEKKNRIQVSNTKKPFFFYLNLAKRYIKQHNDVELSALGMAIPTIVTIAEILKSNGVAVEKKVLTSTVGSKDEIKGRLVQKAKLEIVLEKNDNPKTTPETNNQKAVTDTEKAPASANKAKVPASSNKAKVPASEYNAKVPASANNVKVPDLNNNEKIPPPNNDGEAPAASENTESTSATENTKSSSATENTKNASATENTKCTSAIESQRTPQLN